MNKKTTGLVAGAAGAALLMGGATFALWSDSSTVDGGAITAGNLDVGEIEQAWADVSDGRTDRGHEIDLDEFRIIPGDTIQGTFTVPVTLEGENMAAELSLADLGGTGDMDLVRELVTGATYSVSVGGATLVDDAPVVSAQPLRFVSDDNGSPAGMNVLPAGAQELEVVITVPFSSDIDEQDLTTANATLKDFSVTLGQYRHAG